MKRFFQFSILAGLALILSGCTVKSGSMSGLLKSIDGGKTFNEKEIQENSPLFGKNILSLKINPSNHQELFVGTHDFGLFKSIDGGKTWLSDVNNFQSVYDIEFIPNTSVIYMAAKKDGRGKLLKSDNNGEKWIEVYTEKDESSFLTSVAFHPKNPGSIYISNSRGGFFKTEDGGATWKNLYWADSLIRKIEIDKINPGIIYLATAQNGLLKSQDGGNNFETTVEGGYIYNVVADPNQSDSVFVSFKEGLQKSSDQGENWEEINTLVKSEELISRGLAINPNNSQEIYYTSGKTLYKSINGGGTWSTTQFRNNSSIEIIRIDSNNPQIIYLGTNKRSSGFNLIK